MLKKIIPMLFIILLIIVPFASAESADIIWTDISTPEGLAAISANPSGNYRLTADIDMSGIAWKPIPFSGVLKGNHYAIMNLTITEPGNTRFVSIDANKKKYDTVGAALFDCANNAEITDLALLGLGINIDTNENCFCAGLVAGGAGITLRGCTVSGRIWLTQTGLNCGVGGLLGYAQANVADCNADVELVLVDHNTTSTCEEFAGGILSCGVANIINTSAKMDLYASVHGYCHNGGLIGMYWRGTLGQQKVKIDGCSVSTHIVFFEDVQSRRAYNEPYIGEEYSYGMHMGSNQKLSFEVDERKDFSVDLYPCTCRVKYDHSVIPPTDTDYGYTINTCTQCGHTVYSNYTSHLTNH